MPCDIYDSMMIMWAQKDSNPDLHRDRLSDFPDVNRDTLNLLSYAQVHHGAKKKSYKRRKTFIAP
jgi:hypothetical protein